MLFTPIFAGGFAASKVTASPIPVAVESVWRIWLYTGLRTAVRFPATLIFFFFQNRNSP